MGHKSADIVPLRVKRRIDAWKVAVALPGGNLVSRRSKDLWLVPARDLEGADTMLYIRPANERQLLVDLLCAAVGRAMLVPCPMPYQVLVQPGLYGTPRTDTASVMFGSQASQHPDVARPLRSKSLILHNLKQAKLLELAGVFDEWVANPSRHGWQILFGSNAGPIFISHADALNPLIRAADAVKNSLLDEYCDGLSDADRSSLRSLLQTKAAVAHDVDLRLDVSETLKFMKGSAKLLSDMVDFLAQRLPELDRLLSSRAQPKQAYLDTGSGS